MAFKTEYLDLSLIMRGLSNKGIWNFPKQDQGHSFLWRNIVGPDTPALAELIENRETQVSSNQYPSKYVNQFIAVNFIITSKCSPSTSPFKVGVLMWTGRL